MTGAGSICGWLHGKDRGDVRDITLWFLGSLTRRRGDRGDIRGGSGIASGTVECGIVRKDLRFILGILEATLVLLVGRFPEKVPSVVVVEVQMVGTPEKWQLSRRLTTQRFQSNILGKVPLGGEEATVLAANHGGK